MSARLQTQGNRRDLRPGARSGHVVVDSGPARAWSQYRGVTHLRKVGGVRATRQFNALDLLPMEPIEGVSFLQGDFREPEVLEQLEVLVGERKLDLVVPTWRPTWHRLGRCRLRGRSGRAGALFAHDHLKPEGALVAKVL